MLGIPISEKMNKLSCWRLNIQMIANDSADVSIEEGDLVATDASVKPEVKEDDDEDRKVKVE